DDVLRRLETFGLSRDQDNYAFTVFGTPGPSAPWGWRAEGHHLSLNFTLVPGRPVAMTPAFFGANPAEVPSGPQKGQRVLAAEQDLGRALARSLGEAQRARDHRRAVARRHRQRPRARRQPGRAGGPGPRGHERRPACPGAAAHRGVRAQHAGGAGRPGALAHAAGRRRGEPLRGGGAARAGQGALLPPPRADAADRVRQHAERREPHPLGVARSAAGLRAGSAPRPLPARTPSARLSGRRIYREETTRRWGVGFREGGGGAAGAW